MKMSDNFDNSFQDLTCFLFLPVKRISIFKSKR